ncbi:hypothetical protein NLJ89_g2542 [Agrocybe chaxingu]|uniref:Uncharacterized protein n=1 Tax=Agrocybe chaxingu TaxID=84603 RepID=A0A9W8K745_9AGAR|nr:hypothetical protein NLJ89_g2542 [Agrocybe chaxingu]
MMSRITLNLRRAGEQLNSETDTVPKSFLFDHRRRARQASKVIWDTLSFSRGVRTTQQRIAIASVTRDIELTFARPVTSTMLATPDAGAGVENPYEKSLRPTNEDLKLEGPRRPPPAITIQSDSNQIV